METLHRGCEVIGESLHVAQGREGGEVQGGQHQGLLVEGDVDGEGPGVVGVSLDDPTAKFKCRMIVTVVEKPLHLVHQQVRVVLQGLQLGRDVQVFWTVDRSTSSRRSRGRMPGLDPPAPGKAGSARGPLFLSSITASLIKLYTRFLKFYQYSCICMTKTFQLQ